MKSELRHSPDTILLDREIVFIHLDSEEPSLTPVGAPTVSSDPVLCPCFCISAPTNLEASSNELLTCDVVHNHVSKCTLWCCIISPQIWYDWFHVPQSGYRFRLCISKTFGWQRFHRLKVKKVLDFWQENKNKSYNNLPMGPLFQISFFIAAAPLTGPHSSAK